MEIEFASLLEGILRDLAYAARTLTRTPGFAIMAILVMALGIGANTALFLVVHSVLLKPLPFADPAHLVMLYERAVDGKYPFNVIAPGGVCRVAEACAKFRANGHFRREQL